MVIYKREKKKLIIPSGLGVGVGDCSEAIAEAKAEQEAADRAKLEILNVYANGIYEPEYGYKGVGVHISELKYLDLEFYFTEPALPPQIVGLRNCIVNGNADVTYGMSAWGISDGYGRRISTKSKVQADYITSASFEMAILPDESTFPSEIDYMVYNAEARPQTATTPITVEYVGTGTTDVGGVERNCEWYRLSFNHYAFEPFDNWKLSYQSGYTVGYRTGSLDTIWEYWISIAFNIQGQGDYADLVKSQVSYTDKDGNEINPFDLQHNWLNYKGQVLTLFGNTQAFAYGVIKQNGYGSPQMGYLTIKAPEDGDFTSRYLYIRRKYDAEFAFPMFECDAVEFAENTQVSSIFKSVITDSSQFPMQQSFDGISRPIMTIDGVEGYYDTIPAGTHTLSFRGGSEFSDDMQIDITNFKGEIRIY